MLLLHPRRLRGVVISAPGRVTLVDTGSGWPRGTADVAGRFGLSIDAAAIARTSILLSIGSEDLGTADLAAQRDPSQDGFGRTRRERLDTLANALRALGADPAIYIAPGGTHAAPAWNPRRPGVHREAPSPELRPVKQRSVRQKKSFHFERTRASASPARRSRARRDPMDRWIHPDVSNDPSASQAHVAPDNSKRRPQARAPG